MNKIFTLIFSGMLILPAYSACPLDMDKPCTATILDTTNSTLRERVLPNPLDDIKKTDAFQPEFVKPYHENMLNTEEREYNSNCQFGVCLPERSPHKIKPTN